MQPVVPAAKAAATVVADPARETLRVRGSDAKSWLNGLVSCDLASLGPGRGAYGLLLSKQGKVQSDLDIVELEPGPGLLVGVAAGLGEKVRDLLDSHLVMEDAELFLESSLGWLRVIGPRSLEVALQVPGAEGRAELDWLGLGGAAVVVSRDTMNDAARQAVQAAGSSATLGDLDAWRSLRVASGFPAFGVDYTSEDNPHEASLDRRAVSFQKGCYLGQEVVYMQDARGKVKRRVVLVSIEGSAAIPAGTPILQQATGASVGSVTSPVADGTRTLALAKIQAPFYQGHTGLSALGHAIQLVGPDGEPRLVDAGTSALKSS